MKLTTPLQKNLICGLLGLLAGAVAVGFFFSARIAELRKQQAGVNTSNADTVAALTVSKDVDVAKLARRSAMRDFPPHIDRLLKNLSDWGYWAPGKISVKDGDIHMDSARYKGNSPAKHSYARLASAGALESTPQGYIILYMILATEADRERSRISGGGIDLSEEAGKSSLSYGNEDLEAVFKTSDAARNTLGQLQEFQGILITYQDELIADGSLAK